jgi:hypothetical protein
MDLPLLRLGERQQSWPMPEVRAAEWLRPAMAETTSYPRVQIDAHIDATRSVLLLCSNDVPGFVKRVKLREDGKNDLARMMREYRIEAEAKLQDRANA